MRITSHAFRNLAPKTGPDDCGLNSSADKRIDADSDEKPFFPMSRRRSTDGSNGHNPNVHLALVPEAPAPSPGYQPISHRTVFIPTADIPRWFEDWCNDGSNLSPCSIQQRVAMVGKLLWFLENKGHERCGLAELRAFAKHLETGHLNPEGRWGQGSAYGGRRALRPVSQYAFHRNLKAFFNWLVGEGIIPLSPMDKVDTPDAKTSQIEHFTQEHILALLVAAGRAQYPLRDTALIWFLLDTGMRATECCQVRQEDLDLRARRVHIRHGKGDKERIAYFNKTTEKALRSYLRSIPQSPGAPLFVSESGQYTGEPLTRGGLGIIIRRLGRAARLTGVRCSPHTFRHTYTFLMLNDGAPLQSVQESLGHSDCKMTLKYSKFAQADVAGQHRRHSPAEQIAAKLRRA